MIKTQIRADQIEGGIAGLCNHNITARLIGLTEKSTIEMVLKQLLFQD